MSHDRVKVPPLNQTWTKKGFQTYADKMALSANQISSQRVPTNQRVTISLKFRPSLGGDANVFISKRDF